MRLQSLALPLLGALASAETWTIPSLNTHYMGQDDGVGTGMWPDWAKFNSSIAFTLFRDVGGVPDMNYTTTCSANWTEGGAYPTTWQLCADNFVQWRFKESSDFHEYSFTLELMTESFMANNNRMGLQLTAASTSITSNDPTEPTSYLTCLGGEPYYGIMCAMDGNLSTHNPLVFTPVTSTMTIPTIELFQIDHFSLQHGFYASPEVGPAVNFSTCHDLLEFGFTSNWGTFVTGTNVTDQFCTSSSGSCAALWPCVNDNLTDFTVNSFCQNLDFRFDFHVPRMFDEDLHVGDAVPSLDLVHLEAMAQLPVPGLNGGTVAVYIISTPVHFQLGGNVKQRRDGKGNSTWTLTGGDYAGNPGTPVSVNLMDARVTDLDGSCFGEGNSTASQECNDKRLWYKNFASIM